MCAPPQRQAATSPPCAACSSSSARVNAASICCAQVSTAAVVLVVAPPGIVALEHAFERIAKAAAAELPRQQRPADLVGEDAFGQMARPGPEDQRRRARRPPSCRRRPRAAPAPPPPAGALDFAWRRYGSSRTAASDSWSAWIARRLSRSCFGVAASSCAMRSHAVRRRPFVGQVVRIVGRDGCAGSRSRSSRARGSISRGVCCGVEEAGPVVARVPARRRHLALQVVLGLAQRHACRPRPSRCGRRRRRPPCSASAPGSFADAAMNSATERTRASARPASSVVESASSAVQRIASA